MHVSLNKAMNIRDTLEDIDVIYNRLTEIVKNVEKNKAFTTETF